MKNLLLSAATAVIATAGLFAQPAQAVELPCETAELIVPWKPGGGTHVIFSLFEKTINELDEPYKVKVISVPGQGGNKGMKEAAKAKPDGCTLFAIHQSAVTSFLQGRVNFHYNEFEPIANLTKSPSILGAKPDAPFNNLEEFIAYAKENPGGVKVGATFGSTSHFVWLLVAKEAGIELSYVPYEGTAERMTALLSGAIDMGEINVTAGQKHLTSGALKAVAIAADERAAQLPDLMTLREQGMELDYALERGMVAPKGTPKEVIDLWAGIIEKATQNPELQEALAAKGTGLRFQGPAEYQQWIDNTYAAHEAVAIEIGMYKK